ncbi:MAG: EAL domain-containing protein [Rhodobacteraceae bacterium]|nr:EAL domain-containing protein [Paracoccaceae bacterium]
MTEDPIDRPDPGDPDTLSPLAVALTARDRAALELVREALRRGDVLLAFQPVVRSRDPGSIAFHEGLIRVLDPQGRVIPARQFIAAAEMTEAGRILDSLALELGLAELAREPGLRLSINMSARSIAYPRWTEALHRGLERDPTAAERLILEITEASAMVIPDITAHFMKGLQRKGISFALDDFGAGFTAFRYLRDFTFDAVKLDGQFIRGIHADPDNQCLARALLSIAEHFDMFTIAEAVETPEEATFLADLGFDCQQGYVHGAPTTMPPWRAREAAQAQG